MPQGHALPAGSGGVLGLALGEQGAEVFGLVGLTVLCIAGVLVGVQAAVGFSWLEMTEMLGRTLTRAWHKGAEFYDRMNDLRQARAQQRQASVDPVAQKRKSELAATLEAKQSIAETPTAPAKTSQICQRLGEEPSGKTQQKRLFDSQSVTELPDVDLLDQPNGNAAGETWGAGS